MAPHSLPKVSRSLPMALLRAREGVMIPIREMLADSGVTEQQWRVLRILAEYGPVDSTSLAERANLHFPSLTRITQSMHSKEYISLTRDPGDLRRQVIAITKAGQQLIDAHSDQANKIAESHRTKLGEERYEQLLDLLALLDPKLP